jgi:DNA replication and repair protein RecF
VKLKKLKLENFRNHGSYELDLSGSDRITYLVGPNASGKTNVLEAIYVLALVKSFRGQGAEDLVGWGGDHCRVSGELDTESEAGTVRLEAFFGMPPNPRHSFKVNGVKKSAADFIGNCRVVLFHPEDLNMLYLGPDLRRRYLDMLNIQVSRGYYRALAGYRKVLKQRNSLLKAINEGYAKKTELEVWNNQLVESGAVLMAERAASVDFMNGRLSSIYGGIAGGGDEVSVSYKASVDGLPYGGVTADEGIKDAFHETLAAALTVDLRAEVTTTGPHRDELLFSLNGRPLASHASRGEYRSILLAMKMIEIDYLKSRGGTDPILRLDDVFSELDPEPSSRQAIPTIISLPGRTAVW